MADSARRPSFRIRPISRSVSHAAVRDRRQRSAHRGPRDAGTDGRRRHPRSAGRRLLPLQRRCRMDDSAFREDALRQRPAARAVRRFRARDGRVAVRRGRARHRRLDDARDARSGRRFLLEPRRRQRRRGRQVLRLVAGRGARACSRADEFAVAAPHWGLDGAAKFRRSRLEPARARRRSKRSRRCSGFRWPDARARLARAKSTLFAARSKRVRPGLDDKILTSWNALAIAGLARAARALDESGWADLAIAAADALRATVWRNGRLLATRKDERAHLNAYLDDHAFLLDALLELMQTRFRRDDFEWACEIADLLLAQFEDRDERRLLFHESRSRASLPSHQARSRQRDAVRQRRGGSGADCARASRRATALRRGGRTSGARVRSHASRIAARMRHAADGAGGHACAARVGAAGGRRRGVRRLAARASSAGCGPAFASYNVAGADLPPALVKGPAPAERRGRVGVSRYALPATGCMRWTRSNASSRERSAH